VRQLGVLVSRAPILDRLPAAAWIILAVSAIKRGGASLMRPQGTGSDEFIASQREGLETRHADQERTLAAMHRLEKALESAAPGRERSWRDEVMAALTVLGEATIQEAENADRPESLLSDIARNQPRLRNRVRGIRTQYRQLRERIEELERELNQPQNEAPDFADLRQRLAWVLTALRHVRARESDLLYEAYYDAFRTDLNRDLGM
jgi:chromosome segregation ATPase